MTKHVITLIAAILLLNISVAAQKEYHYKMIKTGDTKLTDENRYEPYYYENIHPPEKLFKKTKNEYARISKQYYPDGTLQTVFYEYKRGRNYNLLTYMTKRYHPNGTIAVEDYVNPMNTKLEGYRNTFYDNGQLESTVCRIGVAYIYGIKRTFHRNGQLASTGLYKGFVGASGQELGPWRYYHDNGQLAAEGSYTNHFAKGNISAESKKRGEWKYYDENGELIKTENY